MPRAATIVDFYPFISVPFHYSNTMKIADIDLGPRPLMLAPMEDVTDPSFRLICKEMGADMVTTEFVSSDALIRNIAATTRK